MYEFFELLLLEQGKTVADVCRATGIRASTLSNWKKRRNKISYENGKKIADFLGCSLNFLYGREDDQKELLNSHPDGVRFADVDSLLFDKSVLRDAGSGMRVFVEDGVLEDYRKQLRRLRAYYDCIKNLSDSQYDTLQNVIKAFSDSVKTNKD